MEVSIFQFSHSWRYLFSKLFRARSVFTKPYVGLRVRLALFSLNWSNLLSTAEYILIDMMLVNTHQFVMQIIALQLHLLRARNRTQLDPQLVSYFTRRIKRLVYIKSLLEPLPWVDCKRGINTLLQKGVLKFRKHLHSSNSALSALFT